MEPSKVLSWVWADWFLRPDPRLQKRAGRCSFTSVYCVLLRGRVRALHVRGAKDRLSGLFSSHHMGLRGPAQVAWLSGVSLAADLSHQTFPSRYVVAS